MARLKFVLFALVAVAVAGYHLLAISPLVSARAQALAAESARTAASAVRGEVERQKTQLASATLAARTSSGVLTALATGPALKPTTSAEERLELLRAPMIASLPESLRARVRLGLSQDSGGARADAETAAIAAEGAELAALAATPGEVTLHSLEGAPHLVTAVSLAPAPATLVLALPLDTAGLVSIAPVGGSLGVGLLLEGKVLGAAGSTTVDGLGKQLANTKPGLASTIERGHSAMLGPVALPLLAEEAQGVQGAPLRVAYRVALGSGLEAAAVVGLESFQASLASGQRQTLLALAGLAVLALIFVFLFGSNSPKAAAAEPTEEESTTPSAANVAVLPLAAAAQQPEVGPDDFQFGANQEARAEPQPDAAAPFEAHDASAPFAAAGGWAPEAGHGGYAMGSEESTSGGDRGGYDPHAVLAQAPLDPPSPASYGYPAAEGQFEEPGAYAPPAYGTPSHGAQAYGGESDGAAYGAQDPDAGHDRGYAAGSGFGAYAGSAPDPFGMVSQASGPSYAGDDNPDATRVAAVPHELLRASAHAMGGSEEYPRSLGALPPVAQATPADPDEQHFHEVFQEFVATRERCGEGSDGLTYEKFVAKLRKNREQLVQKYACRTVRFQVYVKEGKAALKATPVKD